MRKARPRIRLCLEQLEARLVLSSSPIEMNFATTTDSRTISVNYTITGNSLAGQNVSFNIYRSPTYNSLGGAQLIGIATIPGSDSSDLSVGTHTGIKLSLTSPNGQAVTALTPNTALPFIVVVANVDGSSASFETHVLGVIAHGLDFDLTSILLDQVPAWETQMAVGLQAHGGYEVVLPFNWVRLSVLPSPIAVQIASNQLASEVIAEANQLASQHPGDVVDINFIGHSRGTVVISHVLQDLVATTDPALKGGYMQMTLLDPHPANPAFSPFSAATFLPQASDIVSLVFIFEALTLDPQVAVPSNADQVQEFDEQTPAGQLGFLMGFLETLSFSQILEFVFNTWGEKAAALLNYSSQPIEQMSLTNLFAANIGLIGHSEVPLWYLVNVVNTNKTFTYFG